MECVFLFCAHISHWNFWQTFGAIQRKIDAADDGDCKHKIHGDVLAIFSSSSFFSHFLISFSSLQTNNDSIVSRLVYQSHIRSLTHSHRFSFSISTHTHTYSITWRKKHFSHARTRKKVPFRFYWRLNRSINFEYNYFNVKRVFTIPIHRYFDFIYDSTEWI